MKRYGSVIVMLCLAAGVVSTLTGCTGESAPVREPGEMVDAIEGQVARIESLSLGEDPNDLQELQAVAETAADSRVRERAMFVLAERALRDDRVDQVADWLVQQIPDADISSKSAVYANLDLLRREDPAPPRGSLHLLVAGDLKPGALITVVFFPSTTADAVEARVGVRKIIGGSPGGAGLVTRRPSRFPLSAGEQTGVPVEVELKEAGLYTLVCELKLTFDMTDYEIIIKEVHLSVGDNGGTYDVVTPVTLPDDPD